MDRTGTITHAEGFALFAWPCVRHRHWETSLLYRGEIVEIWVHRRPQGWAWSYFWKDHMYEGLDHTIADEELARRSGELHAQNLIDAALGRGHIGAAGNFRLDN
jgi:hypothetical protein